MWRVWPLRDARVSVTPLFSRVSRPMTSYGDMLRSALSAVSAASARVSLLRATEALVAHHLPTALAAVPILASDGVDPSAAYRIQAVRRASGQTTP